MNNKFTLDAFCKLVNSNVNKNDFVCVNVDFPIKDIDMVTVAKTYYAFTNHRPKLILFTNDHLNYKMASLTFCPNDNWKCVTSSYDALIKGYEPYINFYEGECEICTDEDVRIYRIENNVKEVPYDKDIPSYVMERIYHKVFNWEE